MDQPATSPRRLHPLVATAAGTVIVASLAATAAITGVFPKASSTAEQTSQVQTAQVGNQPVVDSAAPAGTGSQQAAAQIQRAAPVPGGVNAGSVAGPNANSGQLAQAPYAPPQAPSQAQQYAQAQPRQSPPQPAYRQPAYGQQQQPYSQPYSQQQQLAQQPYAAPQRQAAACASCGTVEAITTVRRAGHGTGVGAVGGAVAGGLIGNQFGAGRGRIAMTVLGAVGGGFAGNAVEKRLRSETDYQVRVRMENGRTQSFTYREAPPFQQGQPVRVVNGSLAAR